MAVTQSEYIQRYVDLNAFQRDVLWVLFHGDGAVYGLAIKRSLEESGYGAVHHGRLYPNLDSLIEMGLIEKGERDGRTNEYELTDKATSVLADRQSWERGEF